MKWKFKTIVSDKGNVFLRRLSFYLKKSSIKIHLITGDDSPVYHTHPWDFTSFIVFGGYREYTKEIRTVTSRYLPVEILSVRDTKMFSINRKLHNEQHRTELYKIFGVQIPTLTIGYYSEKLQLCSFCKEAGYCKSNVKV